MSIWGKVPENVDAAHPTTETRTRHSRDMYLRAHGFEVTDRPNVGPVLWRRGKHGAPMTEALALQICDRLDKCKTLEAKT